MIITINKTISHSSQNQQVLDAQSKVNDPAVKDMLINVLKNSNEYDEHKFNWINDEEVEVKGLSARAMHNVVLRAEEMGKAIEFEKKTIIKIM